MRHAIVRLDMEPGAPVSEKELCLRSGVSRTPVRDAPRRSAEEGLIEVFPRSGTYVAKISLDVAEESFVVRRALEIESIRRASRFVPPMDIAELDALVAKMAEQHTTVVRALKRRNADQAELAMKIHLDASFAVMNAIQGNGAGLKR